MTVKDWFTLSVVIVSKLLVVQKFQDIFITRMSRSTTSQRLTELHNSCGSPDGNLVQPQPSLLNLLHMAGAEGDTFTIKQVMHYLGQYIMVKQLFDKEQQHIVRCGGDELGKLLGITTFSVKDPSPLYEMLKKNLSTACHSDAVQSPTSEQRHDSGSLELQKSSDANKVSTISSLIKRLAEDDTGICQQARLDLSLEEWEGAGLPWWFLGNLRTNYNPISMDGSTDILSNQDVDTALVSDMTDDLWSDKVTLDVKNKPQDLQNGEDLEVRGPMHKVIEVSVYEDNLEDTQSLSDDTDTDIGAEDCWQCTNCHKFNSPTKRYCFRCWALRKDWYADCPPLVHTLSTPTFSAKAISCEGTTDIDIPDCRRSVSAPMVSSRRTQNMSHLTLLDPLDLASKANGLSESTDTIFSCQSAEESLESSRYLLEPCKLCQLRPRNGNVIHGRTAHLVTCFHCARNLQKTHKGCPVCKKPIQNVVKTYVA